MASDALTNGPMYIRSDPNLNIFIIVCPSGVKFGTVWRLHNSFKVPRPRIVFQDQLSLNAGQKYCRMLQGEHSAILLTFIKLSFVIKIFVLSIIEWQFYTGFTVYYNYLISGFFWVSRVLTSAIPRKGLRRFHQTTVNTVIAFQKVTFYTLTLNAPITTKVVCFSRLLKCLRSLYGKQCGPRSDCSYRSSLFWVHAVCFYTRFISNARQLFAADDIFWCIFFLAL